MRYQLVCLLALAIAVQVAFSHRRKEGKWKERRNQPRRHANRTRVREEAVKQWGPFKKSHNKRHSGKDDEARLARFVETSLLVAENNLAYEDGLTPTKLAVNEYADALLEELKSMWGHVAEKESEAAGRDKRASGDRVYDEFYRLYVERDTVDSRAIPESWDWREHAGVLRPVKQQGYCGSCWAFAAAAALEGQWAIKKNESVDFSEQNFLDCSINSRMCGGGSTWNAYRSAIKDCAGVATEDDYPYLAQNQACQHRKPTAQIVDFVRLPDYNEEALRHAVARIGPISASMTATNAFLFASEGLFTDVVCDQNQFTTYDYNHEVVIVGYGSNEEWGDYWIIRNSWGVHWADRGYTFMPRGINYCGIEGELYYPIIA